MFISVIIPTRNEEKFIRRCLDSFLYQTRNNQDYEILCVDGMSEDNTAEIIKEYATRDNRVKLIINKAKVTPVGMNLALKQSRGQFIIVVSCHAEYAPDYIEKCLEVMDRTGADQVGGYMNTCPAENTVAGAAIAAATTCRFGVGNSMFRLKGTEREVDTVPFGMYRREVFDKIGLYDERLIRNQDIELNKRLLKAGGKTIISPEIKVKYYNRSTYAGLWRQSFNNGLWNPYTIWLVGGGLQLRHFVPMAFVLSIIALAVGGFFYAPLWWLLIPDVASYFGLAVWFAVKAGEKNKNLTLYVVWAFIVLHGAYGLGSLWAVLTIPFKFPRRKTNKIGTVLADKK
jgi:glycosyltransferase involved in cell wall biosynthesis